MTQTSLKVFKTVPKHNLKRIHKRLVNQVTLNVKSEISTETVNLENSKTANLFTENYHAKNEVLLQTSQAFNSNVVSNSRIQKRILFDNCSQKSFITEELKKQLN